MTEIYSTHNNKKRNVKVRRKKKGLKRKIFVLFTASILIFGTVAGFEICSHIKLAPSNDKVSISPNQKEDNSNEIIIKPSNSIAEKPSENRNTDTDIKTAAKSKSQNQWELALANNSHPLPADYKPDLQSVGNGYYFDKRASQYLLDMLNAAKAEGLSPLICSAYRSEQTQKSLFNNKVASFTSKGYSNESARTEAQTVVAYPGTSEHQLGLAADIVSRNYQILDDKQADTPEAKWLNENCSKFGFILRYPPNKKAITGVIFEPWHFRYVGKEAAEKIMSSGICLEEYLQ